MIEEIFLAGTINKDSVTNPDGLIFHSFGGLLYSIIPLAQLLPDSKIIPIANLGRDCSEDILAILEKYPNVKTDLIRIVEEENNHCHLTYSNQESKTEILSGGVPPLDYSDLCPALNSEIFLLNYISGFDVELETLTKFRSEYKGQIYIDIHSLTLGKQADGRRYFRRPDAWREYCACADYLQMNREEFRLINEADLSLENQIGFFDKFAGNNLKALLITCGNRGAFITTEISGKIDCQPIPTNPCGVEADTTGCGDIFGAAFCAGISLELDFYESARLAVKTASSACNFKGIETLKFKPLN